MKKGNAFSKAVASAPFIMLDEGKSSLPLHRQIYQALRAAILAGSFRAGAKLPSTRALATRLGVSRMTVVVAFDQLYAEGYIEGKSGSGTFVPAELPESFFDAVKSQNRSVEENFREISTPLPAFAPRLLNLSARGLLIAERAYPDVLRSERAQKLVPFQHGMPAVDEFPFEIWSRIAQKYYQNPSLKFLGYGEAAGYRPLREAAAHYLKSARGVKCAPEQVIITSGAHQALTLAAKIFLNPDEAVWIEDPCYTGAQSAFLAAGAKLVCVPVDEAGFDPAAALKKQSAVKLVYVTPSHQYPLGMTMTLARRLQLLEWAKNSNGWIFEDDYNSEYRYGGRPLSSLQGLDQDGRVIYIGTFSKTIFPSLRLGCLVVPPDLAGIFADARALEDLHSPLIEQAILAEFISEGHFARHLRRMRKIYASRQAVLVEEAQKHLKDFIRLEKSDAGMHLVGWLNERYRAGEIAEKAAACQITVSPVSRYLSESAAPLNGLIFGYTCFTENEIKNAVRQLAGVLKVDRKLRVVSGSCG